MKRLMMPLLVLTTILLALVLGGLSLQSKASPQVTEKVAIVKLYSAGNVVATWEASSLGYCDGNSFVFNVGLAPNVRQVRICGTYSVEQLPH